MTTSFRISSGVDLDNVFDPYVQGTKPSATGYRTSDGVDLNQRFAPLSYGTAASATGFRISSGADVNTLWAKKGTAVYSLPINGGSYTASRTTRGDAKLVFNMKNDGTYSVVRSLNGSPDSTLASGTWLPSGASAGSYKCSFAITLGSHTTSGSGNNATTNSATTAQVLSTSQSASATSQSILVGDTAEQFVTVDMRLYTTTGALLSLTTISFHCISDGNS